MFLFSIQPCSVVLRPFAQNDLQSQGLDESLAMSIESRQLLLVIVACFAPSVISLADQDNNLHGGKVTTKQRRAVVHIGPHKTGTTHFQEMLCRNSEFLREKGWIVPTCDRCRSCSAKQFAAVAFEFQERLDLAKPYKCGVRPSLCLAGVIR